MSRECVAVMRVIIIRITINNSTLLTLLQVWTGSESLKKCRLEVCRILCKSRSIDPYYTWCCAGRSRRRAWLITMIVWCMEHGPVINIIQGRSATASSREAFKNRNGKRTGISFDPKAYLFSCLYQIYIFLQFFKNIWSRDMANFKLAVSNFKFSGKLFIGYLEGKSVLVETGILSLLTSNEWFTALIFTPVARRYRNIQ